MRYFDVIFLRDDIPSIGQKILDFDNTISLNSYWSNRLCGYKE